MNPWITHVKQFQQRYGCSYGDALKRASPSYGSSATKKRKRPEGTKKTASEKKMTPAEKPMSVQAFPRLATLRPVYRIEVQGPNRNARRNLAEHILSALEKRADVKLNQGCEVMEDEWTNNVTSIRKRASANSRSFGAHWEPITKYKTAVTIAPILQEIVKPYATVIN